MFNVHIGFVDFDRQKHTSLDSHSFWTIFIRLLTE